MKIVLKTLGKYKIWIILVLVLLFVQAYCDLALPDYTSDIINIGIQSGGIEKNIPEAISETEMNKILAFTTTEESENILSNYTLIEKENNEYIEDYPILQEESIYKLNDISQEQESKLEEIFRLPIVIIYNTQEVESINLDDIDLDIQTIKESYENIESDLTEQYVKAYLRQEYESLGIDIESMQTDYIIKTGAKMIAIALVIMTVTIITTFLASKIAANFISELRKQVVNKVMDFSNAELKNISTSSLITRCTNDIQQIQILIVMLLRIVIYAPILGIGALTKLSGTSLGGVIAVAILAIIGFIILLLVIVMPKFQKIQKLIDKMNMISREILNGLPVIKAFATEKHEEKRFDDVNLNLSKTQLFTRRVMSGLMPYLTLVMNATSVAIVWFASKQIDIGTMQVGDMTAVLTYTIQIIMSFLMLSMISIMGPRAMVSIKRINEVLDTEISIKDKPKEELKTFDKNQKGILEFQNVSFKYPDAEEYMLQDISFKAEKGSVTAFIGSTGSGKSTLVNLIPRFYDVTKGKILIDGVDIRDVSLKELRSKIGFVPQKGFLFSGTIKSNINFGNENISSEETEKAARISCAKSFIEEKENKYESSISQGGTNVSGGQRQRLAIARAIAFNPEFYVFDDSFSALDYKTDSQVRKNIFEEMKDVTIIIVAQRIGTIMNADQIIVLDDGKVVGKGTHSELLQTCETYKEIANSQLSQKEIEDSKRGDENA